MASVFQSSLLLNVRLHDTIVGQSWTNMVTLLLLEAPLDLNKNFQSPWPFSDFILMSLLSFLGKTDALMGVP